VDGPRMIEGPDGIVLGDLDQDGQSGEPGLPHAVIR
jgi:hypothetical protein